MKVALLVALLLLTLAVPTASAVEGPSCLDSGVKWCAGLVIERLTGCNPNYQYVQPCEPDPPI